MEKPARAQNLRLLMLGALGVVFGDIGTSPLYALQTCFFGSQSFVRDVPAILGLTSAVIWSLTLVVSIKYVLILMRADHKGEGGILALTTLVDSGLSTPRAKMMLTFVGILGAALLYSDGIITPAISVMSAVEGLKGVTPRLTPLVIPISLTLLVGLFVLQSRGTGGISVVFGPVMSIWFIVLAFLGILAIVQHPLILSALNPWYAIAFFMAHGKIGFFLLGAIFLALTGAEVLYADMGHFGEKPIRLAWFFIVFPALALNYLGQAALLLNGDYHGTSLFYALCPKGWLVPMIVLSAMSTIIASQAVISGMFSLARQAIQLNLWPRLRQVHTSRFMAGQIFVPFVNLMLFLGTVFLVLFFKKSENLASAYGIAVAMTMLLTTILIAILAWKRWKHGKWLAAFLSLFFIPLSLIFLGANVSKVAHGGWIVLVLSTLLIIIMATWRLGRRVLSERTASQSLKTDLFVRSLSNDNALRVPGVAVFLTGNPAGTPRSLLHNFKHNKIIHEMVFLVTVIFEEVPSVEESRRIQYQELGQGIHRVDLHFGFFEIPDVPNALRLIPIPGFKFKPMQVTFFLGRESLIITPLPGMSKWRKQIFRFLAGNAYNASDYFYLPANRVVEVGLQVEL